MEETKKWVLHHGCHRGTITSRDSCKSEHDTREDAIAAYRRHREFYHSIGYSVWFARIKDPEGVTEIVDAGTPYL